MSGADGSYRGVDNSVDTSSHPLTGYVRPHVPPILEAVSTARNNGIAAFTGNSSYSTSDSGLGMYLAITNIPRDVPTTTSTTTNNSNNTTTAKYYVRCFGNRIFVFHIFLCLFVCLF